MHSLIWIHYNSFAHWWQDRLLLLLFLRCIMESHEQAYLSLFLSRPKIMFIKPYRATRIMISLLISILIRSHQTNSRTAVSFKKVWSCRNRTQDHLNLSDSNDHKSPTTTSVSGTFAPINLYLRIEMGIWILVGWSPSSLRNKQSIVTLGCIHFSKPFFEPRNFC